MARPPFNFTLEPERIAVEAERDELQTETSKRRRKLEEEEQRLLQSREELAETLQRTRAFHDEEVQTTGRPFGADDWLARTEYLDALRTQAVNRKQAVEDQQAAVRTARHTLRNLQNRLSEVELQLKALERARENQLRQWKKAEEQRAEKKRDEEAQMRWTYEQRRRPKNQ